MVPTIAFAPPGSYAELDAGIERLVGYDWIVFTSANGVRCFFDRLHDAHGKDTRALAGVHVAAIGPATARALEAHGISADVVPAVYRAEGVFAAIRDYADADGEDAGGSRGLVGARVFIPRAQVARDVLPQLLCEAGAHVDVAARPCATAASSRRRRPSATPSTGWLPRFAGTSTPRIVGWDA